MPGLLWCLLPDSCTSARLSQSSPHQCPESGSSARGAQGLNSQPLTLGAASSVPLGLSCASTGDWRCHHTQGTCVTSPWPRAHAVPWTGLGWHVWVLWRGQKGKAASPTLCCCYQSWAQPGRPHPLLHPQPTQRCGHWCCSLARSPGSTHGAVLSPWGVWALNTDSGTICLS